MVIAGLVPAYQAEKTVGEVVRGVRAHVEQVLVVDDGSDDETTAAARHGGATVVRHDVNRGKGAALLTGFEALARSGATHALTVDADGQHLPGEIPRLLEAAEREPTAIVVGVRRKEGHAIRGINRMGNAVADRLLRMLAGRAVPDTQSGFRIYPIARTLALGAQGRRFDFETEILLRAARADLRLVGVPVAVHYPPVAERVSHYRPWQDTVRIVRTVGRVWLRRGA
jgi:glycosyltransferase involved in cell wall biosynthesis